MMNNPFLNSFISFTEAEREIMLFVFNAYQTTRKRPMESAIAEEIMMRLYEELIDLGKFDRECKRKRV